MFYRLNDNLRLAGWQKLPYAVVFKGTGQVEFLNKEAFDVISMCNGKVDFDLPLISDRMRKIVKTLEFNSAVIPSEKPSEINKDQEYRFYDNRYISTAHWSITGRCNCKCKHCYMSAPDAKYGELSHEQVMDIVNQIADCGIFNVSLTGGEALVRKDFLEIVDALIERDINITTIYSNGFLVTDALLDELEKRNIYPEFNMSYDGVDCHDWLRGIEGAEKAVEKAFLRCKDRGFPIGAEMCIHEGNKHILRATINRLAEWGCRSLKTCPITDVGAWHENGYGKSISLEDLFELYMEYIPHYFEDGKPLSLQLGGFFMASPNREGYDIPSFKPCMNIDSARLCTHARNIMYISAEGRVLPCMALSGMDIQNKFPLISENGIKNCITESFYMGFIDTKASEVLKHNEKCNGCEYAKYCLGGCRASALESHPDDLMATDEAACAIFTGGWIKKINDAVHSVEPEIKNNYIDSFLQEVHQ